MPQASSPQAEIEDAALHLADLVGDGDGVVVDDAEDAVVALLDGHPVADGAQVVADVQLAGGLDSAEDSFHGTSNRTANLTPGPAACQDKAARNMDFVGGTGTVAHCQISFRTRPEPAQANRRQEAHDRSMRIRQLAFLISLPLALCSWLGGCYVPPPVYVLQAPPEQVQVAEAPPEPRLEIPPPSPDESYLWQPGYWNYDGSEYRWQEGAWMPPRDGYVLMGASYDFFGGCWHFRAPYWCPARRCGAGHSGPRYGRGDEPQPEPGRGTGAAASGQGQGLGAPFAGLGQDLGAPFAGLGQDLGAADAGLDERSGGEPRTAAGRDSRHRP